MHYDELMTQVRASFPTLSAQFRLGARYLIDHPDDVAISSMRTVADAAGVQASTLVRLAQHLGFKGWPALKEIFVERLRPVRREYARKAKRIAKRKDATHLIPEVFDAQRANLSATENRNAEYLLDAVKLIEGAKQVHVAGFRASFAMAYTFQYLYRLFRNTVQIVGGQAATLEMGLRAIMKDDAVVIISFAPYSEEAIRVAEIAQRIGCKLIAITDSSISPVALPANATVVFAADSPSFFPSTIAGLGAVECLIGLLVSRAGHDAVRRISEAEQQLFELGAYRE